MSKLYDLLSAMCGKIKKPDWNQNDSTAADYVKNRPFYTGDPVETVLVEESTVPFTEFSGGIYQGKFSSTFYPKIGKTYKVSWDGTLYECICTSMQDSGSVIGGVIGNASIIGSGSDSGEPFLMIVPGTGEIIIGSIETSDSHTFSISGLVPEIVKIDEKYLPDTVATEPEVAAVQTAAEAAQTAADKNKETLSQMLTYVKTFTFDKQTSGRDTFVFNAFKYYKISDFNPAPEDVISFTGTRENGYNLSDITAGNNCVEYGLFIVVASAGDCSIAVSSVTMHFTAPSAGLYAIYEEGNQGMTAGTGEFTLRFPIGIVLRSSGSYSTKQFKITVDDSGTLTATEVTA